MWFSFVFSPIRKNRTISPHTSILTKIICWLFSKPNMKNSLFWEKHKAYCRTMEVQIKAIAILLLFDSTFGTYCKTKHWVDFHSFWTNQVWVASTCKICNFMTLNIIYSCARIILSRTVGTTILWLFVALVYIYGGTKCTTGSFLVLATNLFIRIRDFGRFDRANFFPTGMRVFTCRKSSNLSWYLASWKANICLELSINKKI